MMKAALVLSALALVTVTAFAQIDPKTVSQEGAILAAEHAWLDAVKKSDVNALQGLLRDDYINLDVSGRVQTKVEVLKETDEIASNPKKSESQALSLYAVRVRIYGDVAVLTGGAGVGGPKGSPIRFSHVWVKTKDQWLLSTSQTTRVAPLPNVPHPPVKIEKPR